MCTRKVICDVTDALRFICNANTVKCRYYYYYYFKLYNITTLVAKFRIDSFRLRGTGSMCHMFLLNVEFSNSCRFRVFQCHSSTVSRFPFPRFQLPHVDTDEQSTGSCRIFTKHSKCCDKFFVLTMSLCTYKAYFATL